MAGLGFRGRLIPEGTCQREGLRFPGRPLSQGDGTGVGASGHKWGPGTGPETKPEVSGLTNVQRFPASLPC